VELLSSLGFNFRFGLLLELGVIVELVELFSSLGFNFGFGLLFELGSYL
jgi:hypothetical protein